MSKTDFSHLFLRPEILIQSLDHGYPVPDENWLAVVREINPPLFSDAEFDDFCWILDPSIERRGGPSLALVSEPLVQTLMKLDRPHIPAKFIDALIKRLSSGKRHTRADSNRQYAQRWRKFERDRMFVYLYDYICAGIEAGHTSIEHEAIEPIQVSARGSTTSEKAIATLHDFVTERLVYRAPAESTLLKIISEAKDRKKRTKS